MAIIWGNVKTFHHRILANFLRKRGWVVFYLEDQHRVCNEDTCWLKLYLSEESNKNKPKQAYVSDVGLDEIAG
jgi:hypothetical protein